MSSDSGALVIGALVLCAIIAGAVAQSKNRNSTVFALLGLFPRGYRCARGGACSAWRPQRHGSSRLSAMQHTAEHSGWPNRVRMLAVQVRGAQEYG
jgi:hypothetical protein